MASTLMERLQLIKGIDPVADFADTVQSTDVIDMSEFLRVLFVIHKGVGATGTSTITVEGCDDTTPSNTTAIPFEYRAITTGDTEGAITAATATGFTTTAGSSQLYAIEIREDALAALGYRYVRMKMTEVVNSPVLGGVEIVGEKKNARAIATSAID